MAQRTINDDEIALIKAMVARGMKNRDIQFYFNRPGRAVNSGRITDISSGKYGNSAKIAKADNAELDAFMAEHPPSLEVPPTSTQVGELTPLSEVILQKMFVEDAGGVWRLAAGETDRVECKESFRLKHAAPWLRALAALANNQGGYIFFGVKDKDPTGSHAVLGLTTSEFADTDPADIVLRLRAVFTPTPRFERTTFEVGGKKIGVLYVEQHPSRPIIATKQEGSGEIKEGDIFFRYPGQSARISYADLRAMLDARDAQARADILPMLQRLLSLGRNRAMIADLNEGRLFDGTRTIEIDEAIIKELNLIKEGEFNERIGAPALRLIGNVMATTSTAVKKGLVTRPQIQLDFLADKLTADPLDYIRCAVEVPGADWLPIRYFARAAGMSLPELLTFINENPASIPTQKQLYKGRLASADQAYVAAKGPSGLILQRLRTGEKIEPKDAPEARQVAFAIQGLPRPLSLAPTPLRALLARCAELIGDSDDKVAKSAIRKAVARLDELIYA